MTLHDAITESRRTDTVVDLALAETSCLDMAALQAEAFALGYESDEIAVAGEDDDCCIHEMWGWTDDETGRRTAASGRSEWKLSVTW